MKNLQGASHICICLHAAMLEGKFLFSLLPSLCVPPGKKWSGDDTESNPRWGWLGLACETS